MLCPSIGDVLATPLVRKTMGKCFVAYLIAYRLYSNLVNDTRESFACSSSHCCSIFD